MAFQLSQRVSCLTQQSMIAFRLFVGMVILPMVYMSSVFGQSSNKDAWFDFAPGPIATDRISEIDLRFLNEKMAGENGFIETRDGHFVFGKSGKPVRFWAVNGPPQELQRDDLKKCARLLARYGVNLVRVHTPIFDRSGEPDREKIQKAHAIVAAMKAEGIYTHFSIYFPLWFSPSSDVKWLEGYDGKTHPFAALMFNHSFQTKYRSWLRALLTTPEETTGKRLIDEPAVFGIELQNEDSLFFWTFNEKNIPDAQMRIIEKQFGDWLIAKLGSVEAAMKRWNNASQGRDSLDEGRIAMRPLWNIANERTPRDQDTATFLLETQSTFYRSSYEYLRGLGFRGLIHASNWATASPEVLGPLEKLSYATCDFIDRHGYFECNHQGDNAAWSVRSAHTYNDRSALRFDASIPSKPKQFVHPVMDPKYDNKPSMISETTFTRPNRYRSEAPLYFACYGALQDSDAIVHFAFDGDRWSVKPGYFMQPWTVASPAMLGQFPVAALIYRQGLVRATEEVANIQLNIDDLLNLSGTPLPQDAAFDVLRLKDVPKDTAAIQAGQRLDPLLHFVGRTNVIFSSSPTSVKSKDLKPFVDRTAQTVRSLTGELQLDYGKGVLIINAARVQGACGNLKDAGPVQLKDLTLESDMDLMHIVVVSLDDQPIATSKRMLLQVMSEERASGFETEPAEGELLRIKDIGHDPWQVKNMRGKVNIARSDAARLKVMPLDFQGRAVGSPRPGGTIELQTKVIYYLISN